MTYFISETDQRKVCQACGKTIAMVMGRSGRTVPVNIRTRESHFKDCTDPERYSRPKPAPPPAVDPRQRALFE